MSDPMPSSPAATSRFTDRVAVITGGASGIGLATGRRIVAEGGRVLLGDVRQDALDEAAGVVGDSAATFRCDVTNEDDVAALVDFAVDRFGRIDVVVANAGRGLAVPIAEHSLDDWQGVLDVTLTGVFLTIRAAARVLPDGGAIVATASLNAVQPARGMAAYCAAKAGVVALVDVASLELGPRNIRVNAVAPGLVRTPMTEGMWALRPIVDSFESNTALGRHATPDEIAAAVAFLASDDAAFVTGTTLLVDGGAHHLSYPDLGAIHAESS